MDEAQVIIKATEYIRLVKNSEILKAMMENENTFHCHVSDNKGEWLVVRNPDEVLKSVINDKNELEAKVYHLERKIEDLRRK